MRAGLLKEIITILTPIVKKNKFGEQTQEWKQKFVTKARVQHNSANRTNENGDIFYSSVLNLEVRYYVNVDEYDNIIWKDKKYRILSIIPDKDNNKNIPCQQTDDRGRMVVENGRLYFALGKNMILVSEHFNQNGKDIETLLESAIRHAAVDTTEALKNSA